MIIVVCLTINTRFVGEGGAFFPLPRPTPPTRSHPRLKARRGLLDHADTQPADAYGEGLTDHAQPRDPDLAERSARTGRMGVVACLPWAPDSRCRYEGTGRTTPPRR